MPPPSPSRRRRPRHPARRRGVFAALAHAADHVQLQPDVPVGPEQPDGRRLCAARDRGDDRVDHLQHVPPVLRDRPRPPARGGAECALSLEQLGRGLQVDFGSPRPICNMQLRGSARSASRARSTCSARTSPTTRPTLSCTCCTSRRSTPASATWTTPTTTCGWATTWTARSRAGARAHPVPHVRRVRDAAPVLERQRRALSLPDAPPRAARRPRAPGPLPPPSPSPRSPPPPLPARRRPTRRRARRHRARRPSCRRPEPAQPAGLPAALAVDVPADGERAGRTRWPTRATPRAATCRWPTASSTTTRPTGADRVRAQQRRRCARLRHRPPPAPPSARRRRRPTRRRRHENVAAVPPVVTQVETGPTLPRTTAAACPRARPARGTPTWTARVRPAHRGAHVGQQRRRRQVHGSRGVRGGGDRLPGRVRRVRAQSGARGLRQLQEPGRGLDAHGPLAPGAALQARVGHVGLLLRGVLARPDGRCAACSLTAST